VGLETRFARAPSGPVPYRVDGSGSRQLLIVSDWAKPYGEPGMAAFDAFARDLADQDAMAVTLLDGTLERGGAKRPDVERRIAGARAAAGAAELGDATLLGTGDGALVAAMLAVQEPARFSRLILHDTFPSESRKTWAVGGTPDAAEARADLENLESELKTASAAWEWAQNLWRSKGKGPPADLARLPVPPPDGSQVPTAGWAGGPPQLKDGLAQLLQHVASLERLGQPHAGGGLSGIALPTVVLEVRTDGAAAEAGGSLGMQVAAEIPGAIHRGLSGTSRWPWGEAQPITEILAAAPALPGGRDKAPAKLTTTEPARVLATVLFTDIVGSTERLAELGDAAWRELLTRHHQAVRDQLARFDGREVDTAGDGFLAAFEAPARAVRCAVAIRDEVRGIGLSVRCGLHTGECEQIGEKLVGIAVHIGARIAAHASADEVLVSSTVRDLVAGAGIVFADRGPATLKGLPGEWLLYAVSEVG
jgi:class 3 adenylate cyclase